MQTPICSYLGIDFSGYRGAWGPNARASNVWVAEVEDRAAGPVLVSLQRVQLLPGPGRPFTRLATRLRNGGFSAAAIDAPFSVPWWFFGPGLQDHPGLVAAVNALPLMPNQDFPTGGDFVARVSAPIPFPFTKPLRTTECYWRGRGVSIRSPVWAGQRPGAPFTSACIKLIAQAGRPVWPWAGPDTSPLLEAFPAAQLRHWGLPFEEYNGVGGQPVRAAIVADLQTRRGLQVAAQFQPILAANADALDAVLCCFAARAVTRAELGVALPPKDAWGVEGWIAVHK